MGAGVRSLYREIQYIEVWVYVEFIGKKGTVSTFLNNVLLNTNDIIFYTQKNNQYFIQKSQIMRSRQNDISYCTKALLMHMYN